MRKTYLDNIRWITVILVVIYHVFYMYNGEGIPGVVGKITDLEVQYWDIYQYIVYPWFMGLLFIVSGICARHSLEKHTNGEFIRRRTTRYLVPATISPFVFGFVQGYVNMAIGGAFDSMGDVPKPVIALIMVASGISVLWYLQVLWLYSVLLVLVRRIEKGRLLQSGKKTTIAALVLIAVPVWAAAQVLNTPIIAVYRLGLYMLLFFLGYFVFSHEEVIDVLKKWFLPLAIAACVLGIAFCAVCFGQNYADRPVNRTPLFTGYCWFACLAILGGMAKYCDFETGFTRWMSSHSFGLYVFHYLGISAFALYIGKSRLLPAPVTYLLTLACGFAAGYLLYAAISRIPFFRWAVLGIRREKD